LEASIEQKHEQNISGTLSCVDRIVLKGQGGEKSADCRLQSKSKSKSKSESIRRGSQICADGRERSTDGWEKPKIGSRKLGAGARTDGLRGEEREGFRL